MSVFAAGAWAVIGTTAAIGAYGANQSANAANDAADATALNASRRYELEAGVAQNQMDEQQQLATEKMTDVTRAFLKAKGTAKAVQAETGTSGNVSKRMRSVDRLKESEAKGKIAKEIDTNVVNIAQGMLASKIDTEATIADAMASKKNVFTSTLMGGLEGAQQGMSFASSASGLTGASPSQAPGASVTPSGGRPGTGPMGGQ